MAEQRIEAKARAPRRSQGQHESPQRMPAIRIRLARLTPAARSVIITTQDTV